MTLTAHELAEALRAMRRSAGLHMPTQTRGLMWSIVLDDIHLGNLTDAASLIDDLVRQRDEAVAAAAATASSDSSDARLRVALTEIRDRIQGHPAYAELNEAEEIEVGGDTAELSYLARVADDALGIGGGENG